MVRRRDITAPSVVHGRDTAATRAWSEAGAYFGSDMKARALVSRVAEGVDIPTDGSTPLNHIQNWDSLSTVALVLKLEEAIGRELTDDEVEGLRTLGDVEAILSRG